MIIAALDLGLTHCGWARTTGDGPLSGVLSTNKLRGCERLSWLRDEILFLVKDADLVLIEGYSYGSPNKREALGELGGVVRLALFEEGIPFMEVPPKSVKVFATNNGNASKPAMQAAAWKRLGYEGHDEHEVDAIWLLALGRIYYEQIPPKVVPATHLRALAHLTFPIPRQPELQLDSQ